MPKTPDWLHGIVEAAVRAYAQEGVLARQRRRVDRSELHPGDVGLDIEGDVQVAMRLVNRDAMRAALEAAAPDPAASAAKAGPAEIDLKWTQRILDHWCKEYGVVLPTDFIADEIYSTYSREANAQLFAAAPDTAAERDRLRAANVELVAALKEAVGFCGLCYGTGRAPASQSDAPCPDCRNVRTVLAKEPTS